MIISFHMLVQQFAKEKLANEMNQLANIKDILHGLRIKFCLLEDRSIPVISISPMLR